jgi:DNA modification methylase
MSVKPEPMLRHFFEMFVDESTIFLDPTCGSGSSLRAAEGLGASHVLGLERNSEFHESASRALRSARLMRRK